MILNTLWKMGKRFVKNMIHVYDILNIEFA